MARGKEPAGLRSALDANRLGEGEERPAPHPISTARRRVLREKHQADGAKAQAGPRCGIPRRRGPAFKGGVPQRNPSRPRCPSRQDRRNPGRPQGTRNRRRGAHFLRGVDEIEQCASVSARNPMRMKVI